MFLEGVSCSFKEVADLIKWCACDWSWIYWQISSLWLAGFGTRWWLDALRGWWRPRCAFSCLWWWTCWLHTLSPAPSAGSWCKGRAFYAHDDNCWPQAAAAQHLQEKGENARKILDYAQNHRNVSLHTISSTAVHQTGLFLKQTVQCLDWIADFNWQKIRK